MSQLSLDQDSVDRFAKSYADQTAKLLSIGGGTRTGGGGGGAAVGASLEGVFASAVGGLSKLAGGTFDTTTALGLMRGALEKVPLAGSSVALMFGTFGEGIINANKSLNEMGKGGVDFGNNLGLMTMSITGARITIDEFQSMMQKGSTAVTALGGNATRGATAFLELSKDIQETKIVQDLVESGVSTKELNDLTLITMMNRRRLDVDDDRQKAAAIESTSKLAQEMDIIAKLTGKSREQQQRDLEAGLLKAEVQATLNQLDDEARINYMNMRTIVGPLGQNIQDLADEIVTGGVRTAEGTARMAALGPAGRDFEAALKQQMAATTEDQRKAADLALMKSKADIAAYQASEAFATQVRFDTTIVGQMAKQQQQQNLDGQAAAGRANEVARIMAEARQKGETIDRAEAMKRAEENLRARALEAQAGFENNKEAQEAAKVARALNATNAFFKDQTAGMGENLEKLNKTVGGVLASQNSLVTNFNGLVSRVKQEDAALAQSGIFTNLLKAAKIGTSASTVSESDVSVLTSPPVKKSTGSLGTVGKYIEDFGTGTLAMLHGREGVVTEDQLKTLVSQTFSMGQSNFNPKSVVSAMLEEITGGIKTAEGAADAAAQSAPAAAVAQPQVIIPPAMNDLSQGIIQLNMRMERLIAAVEDGADKTARAAKGKGNLLA
jgi:hypothetical protein